MNWKKRRPNSPRFHPSSFRLHPCVLARLRTYPQHTQPLLPLLRSRPGGVHKASVVRSPKSDNSSHFQLPIVNCPFVVGPVGLHYSTLTRSESEIGNWQSAMA